MNVIDSFWAFNNFTPAVPQFYWDVKSAEQRIKHICKELHKMAEYCSYLANNINLDHDTINELERQFQELLEGDYRDYYIAKIEAWLEANFPEIVRKHMGIVYPSIDSNGHFILYSAQVMQLSFDVLATEGDDFGRIIIKY